MEAPTGGRARAQVLREREGAVSIRELGELTAIKTDDIISTLQFLALIQYQKGQHVLCGRVQSAAAAGPLRAVAAAAGRAAREPRPRRARPFHGHSRAVDSCCSLTGATKRLPQAEGHHTELPGAWRKPAGSMRRARAAGARGAAADGRRRCVRGQQRAQAVAALAHV